MSDPAQSMIDNLAKNTGRTLEEWYVVLEGTGLEKHTDLMNELKREHGVSHGFANGIVLRYRERGSTASEDDLVERQYAGAKAPLRPICVAIIEVVADFGDDVEVAPKRTSISLRRTKQFAVIEAPSAKRVQLGLQLKGEPVTDRLLQGNAMCSHKVNLSQLAEVDHEVAAWLRAAYERA